jgi:hypothetical protein
MKLKLTNDSSNVQNKNAGNGGDLVKHTVYLATLRYLLQHKPWSEGLLLKECHAGRGLYDIPDGDARRQLLSCLFSEAPAENTILLQRAQQDVLSKLSCWTDFGEAPQQYAGSALMNAYTLAKHCGIHVVDYYEWQSDTRQSLRTALKEMQFESQLALNVLPLEEDGGTFDGEAYIEQHIGEWHKQHLVLLDPFAMWRQPRDRLKRDRYGALVDSLIRRGADAPSLILFWTWGQAFDAADGDLADTHKSVKNGYQDLRDRFHKAEFEFVLVRWRWGFQFAMWIVVPKEHMCALQADLDQHLQLLSDHLVRHGRHLSHPTIQVTIDSKQQQ